MFDLYWMLVHFPKKIGITVFADPEGNEKCKAVKAVIANTLSFHKATNDCL